MAGLINRIGDMFRKGKLTEKPTGMTDEEMQKINDDLKKWESQKVKIAIIGRSGTGKSTLINSLRGLKDKNNPDYCKVGNTQCTMEVNGPFEFPSNRNIGLYDLPGCGTKEFPLKQYPDKVNMDKYDVFILISKDRFYEDDAEIAKMIRKRGKPFFFGRSKIDKTAEDTADNNPDEFNRKFWEEELMQIEKSIMEEWEEYGFAKDIAPSQVFMLSKFPNKMIHYGDEGDSVKVLFPGLEKLKVALCTELPELQRQALIFSLGPPRSEGMLELKKKQLKAQIWVHVTASTASALNPVPGLGAAVDLAQITAFKIFAERQLGIDSSRLGKLAIQLNMTKEEYYDRILQNIEGSTEQKIIRGLTYGMPILDIVRMIGALGMSLCLTEGAEEILKWGGVVTFGITTAIAGALSGTVMYAILNTLLGLQYKFAVECIKFNEKFVQEQMEIGDSERKIRKIEI